jgi:hypothetical protein
MNGQINNVYELTRRGIRTLSGDTANGTTYCFAHHLTINGDGKNLMVAAIRYFDEFVKINNAWFFKKRDLKVAWVETKLQNM